MDLREYSYSIKNNDTGTSGFLYPSWKNSFYPEKLPVAKWLPYYATQFNTLELNNTFYKFPIVKTLDKLVQVTPADFIFSIKAHKIITHTLRMKNAKDTISELSAIAEDGLGDKLGCILFQFPPSFKYSIENLDLILENVLLLSRNVIEFRNPSWWNLDALLVLQKHKLTFCNVSYLGLPVTAHLTSDIFYMRMHGVPELFKSSYDSPALEEMAKSIPDAAIKRFIYFNNTTFEAGFLNALTVKTLLLK